MLFRAQKKVAENKHAGYGRVSSDQTVDGLIQSPCHVRIRITFQGLQHKIRRFYTDQGWLHFGSLNTYLYPAPTYE